MNGYVVVPLEGGVRMFAVVAPEGTIISEHRTCKAALQKARRLNRKRADDEAQLAKRKAAQPLKPAAPQQPCEFGLFGDSHKQMDMKLGKP